jgi:hypothetical protein
MNSLAMNEMWGVNDGQLLVKILDIIHQANVRPTLDIGSMYTCETMGLLHPKEFSIDEPLQIKGNYFKAILEMSLLAEQKRPSDMLKQLNKIKNSICEDIDTYQRLEQSDKTFQVNGDNIMGIVAYLLVKQPTKIQEILGVLVFLKMLYGESIFYNMDAYSYMYSTIWGTIEYLSSRKF